MEYKVLFRVSGYLDFTMSAESEGEAEQIVMERMEGESIPYGNLHDVDWNLLSTEEIDENEYLVTTEVFGYFDVLTFADSEGELDINAETLVEEEDFEDLHDIDWEIVDKEEV